MVGPERKASRNLYECLACHRFLHQSLFPFGKKGYATVCQLCKSIEKRLEREAVSAKAWEDLKI